MKNRRFGKKPITGSTEFTCGCPRCEIGRKIFRRCWNFFKKYTSLFESRTENQRKSTMSLLLRHSWPGNIRELENVARKIVALRRTSRNPLTLRRKM